MTDRDDRSFFIAVKVIETGRQGRFGSCESGGMRSFIHTPAIFLQKGQI